MSETNTEERTRSERKRERKGKRERGGARSLPSSRSAHFARQFFSRYFPTCGAYSQAKDELIVILPYHIEWYIFLKKTANFRDAFTVDLWLCGKICYQSKSKRFACFF